MKKIWIVMIVFVVATCFMIEHKQEKPKTMALLNEQKELDEKRAIFVSYIEYGTLLKGKKETVQKQNLLTMLENIKEMGFNMLLLQVRSFSDAIYPSTIFPWSATISDQEGETPGFDPLAFVIENAKKLGIEVHAWINPYRIRSKTDTSSISEGNPAYAWLNTSHVKVIDGKGIYYNPASSKVEDLIVDGVKEILDHYDVDGIHFDDYFYPDQEIDLVQYLEYQQNGGEMTLKEFRLQNINNMVKRVYQVIKEKDKDLVFGISPEGNIDNNYELNYADTKTWASKEGYVDYLMPQIYFGFENERRPYLETVTMWNDLITNDKVKLLPALAFYKVGLEDKNALSGSLEWIENDDMIKKEILVSRNLSHYQGFSLFRYDYLFSEKLETKTTMKEIEQLKEVLKEENP